MCTDFAQIYKDCIFFYCFVQIRMDFWWFVYIWIDLNKTSYRCVRTRFELYTFLPIRTDSYRFVQTYTNVNGFLRICTDSYGVLAAPLHSVWIRNVSPFRSVPFRTAPLRSVPFRSAPFRLLPFSCLALRSFPLRSVQLPLAPLISAPLHSVWIRIVSNRFIQIYTDLIQMCIDFAQMYKDCIFFYYFLQIRMDFLWCL